MDHGAHYKMMMGDDFIEEVSVDAESRAGAE
jgi:hypothetical protein